jgi:phosphoglycolate phosphatase
MRGVIFDLDGTLVDSLGDIAAAMNRSLAARGFPTHPLDAYRGFIGEGVQKLVERALPQQQQSQAERASLLAAYQEDYAANLLISSALYPGIAPLLDALTSQGMPMAVLSNKPDDATRRLIEGLFGRWHFRAVAGERSGVPRKPDPTAALSLAQAMAASPSEVAFVGDTLVDVQTARAAGMRPIGVLWGFRAAEVAASGVPVVRHPNEILSLLAE